MIKGHKLLGPVCAWGVVLFWAQFGRVLVQCHGLGIILPKSVPLLRLSLGPSSPPASHCSGMELRIGGMKVEDNSLR